LQGHCKSEIEPKYGEKELDMFVDVMMHEPADLVDHAGPHDYIYGKPTKKLCWYLEMFTDDGDNIVDGPEMLVCAGHTGNADGTHVFLKCEGCVPCSNDQCNCHLC
jgi:hypothetical protein